jgi:HD-GYP domain-containing protein (c-di-GMP phosphodiesterase class II)
MDIVISELLEVDIGAQDWLQNAQLLILEKGTLEQGLKIFAKQGYRDAHRVWNQALETETLFAGKPEQYQRLVGLNEKNPFTIFELARETGKAMMAVTPIFHDETFLGVVFPQIDLINSLSRANSIIVEERDRKILEELLAIITVLGIIIIAAVWISRRVTRDLQKISHTAGEIAEGGLRSRTAVRRKDEIGRLAASIDVMADSIEALQEEQESSYMQMLHSLTRALEKKDSYTAAHSGRVAKYSVMLGRKLGLDEQTLKLLKRAALMHDLGKIGIADAVLNKPAPLDNEESSERRLHPSHGKTIMKPLLRFKEFAQIAAWHHEHWDGSGYPDGLKGDEIPLLARIVSIADSWDAMTGDRVYRKGMTQEEALEVLEAEKHSGQWDPRLLTQFIALVRKKKQETRD